MEAEEAGTATGCVVVAGGHDGVVRSWGVEVDAKRASRARLRIDLRSSSGTRAR